MELTYKKISFFAVLYAALPIAVFFIGWLNIPSKIIFTLLLAAGVYFFYKNSSDDDGKFKSITISKKVLVIVAIITFVWCFLAGQGGFVHQSDDNTIRNAIYRDLISKPWPVTYNNGKDMLSYYIAHWMPPAALGKLVFAVSGSTFAAYLVGNISLLLWSSLGCFIVLMLFAMITNTGNKLRIFTAIFIFIFFSGLDWLGMALLRNPSVLGGRHIEWWAYYLFQFSSNSTCLFWVYNQAIVPWILTLCVINEKGLKNLALLGILALPFGPFPFIGLFALCMLKGIIYAVKNLKGAKISSKIKDILREIFSPQNILAILSVIPIYMLYYTANKVVGNASAGASAASGAAQAASSLPWFFHGGPDLRLHSELVKGILTHDSPLIRKFIINYLLLLVCEAGVYVYFVFKKKKMTPEFTGMCIFLMFLPITQFGYANDLCMRVSIPVLIYICVMFTRVVMEEIPAWGEFSDFWDFARNKKLLIAAIIVFIIGAKTSCMEFDREISKTLDKKFHATDVSRSTQSLQDLGTPANFTAQNYKESDFYKYVCKKSK